MRRPSPNHRTVLLPNDYYCDYADDDDDDDTSLLADGNGGLLKFVLNVKERSAEARLLIKPEKVKVMSTEETNEVCIRRGRHGNRSGFRVSSL